MSNTEYQFTHDWFAHAEKLWPQLTPLLPGEPGSREFLEVGAFEGRSAVWIVENMMHEGDILGCIDTWQGGEEHSAEDMGAVESRFDHNIGLLRAKYPERYIDQYKATSTAALADVMKPYPNPTFDFIYIDGSHIAKDVLTDACMAWQLLKPKGLMVFDDYMWGNPRDALHRPKIAIDAFTNIFAEEAEIVHVGYQLVVRKKGE